jgi:hypothetical protein
MKKLAIVSSALGIFTGLGGATHGPGAMLQGNIAPSGIEFKAWPSLTVLNGEPAMTIIPSLLVTGILTILVGIVVAIWSAKYVHHKNSGLILIALTALLLLVGGGIIPPFFGFAAGIIAMISSYRTTKIGGGNA